MDAGLPESLGADRHDGSAWLPETDGRTYVIRDGVPSVYFLWTHRDASVVGARLCHHFGPGVDVVASRSERLSDVVQHDR